MRKRGRNRLDQRRAHRRASRRDAGLGERQDVGAGKRRGAGASAEVTRVEQAVGPISVVGLGERSAEFAQDDALGQGVEIAVAPQGADDLRRLLGAAHRLRRARRGDLARARLRRLAGEKCGDLRRRLRMRGEFGFLPLANPAAAWPARMSLKEGGERGEGRVRVGAQRRPFERRSLGRVSGRRGERHEARDVALPVQDRGLRTGGGGGKAGSAAGAESSGLERRRRRLRNRRRPQAARSRRARQARAPRPQGWRRRIGP